MKLVLENKDGKAVRTFLLQDLKPDAKAYIIQLKDQRRLEVHTSLTRLQNEKTKFDHIADFSRASIAAGPVPIQNHGQLRLVTDEAAAESLHRDDVLESDDQKTWWRSMAAMVVLAIGVFAFLLSNVAPPKTEQQLKQELVQIVRKIPLKPQKTVEQKTVAKTEETPTKTAKPTKQMSVKRLGALSVLGSLNSGKQKGGVNLGAVNTTAGPGLGGTAGSGGVQTTLYGKGLVAAPVGAGSNLQGGGGYGTKGKGGGQAGYGKLSLIGSAGTAAIPLGREALIEGGLDRDLIADVINRNMGQVRFCYEQALQGEPSLAGRVAVAFTIGGNGQVKVAGVDSTTLNSKAVEDCILLRLRSWKFPLPEGGVDVKVSYPFVLRRAGQG